MQMAPEDPGDAPCLWIPVAGTDEVVALPLSELPRDAEEVLDIMKAEQAPLHLWLDLAKAYLSQGEVKSFLYILEEGTDEEVRNFFEAAKFERLQIFCGLAAYHFSLGRAESTASARTEAFAKATRYLNQARLIDPDEQLPFIGLGQLAWAKGDLAVAKREFEKAVQLRCNGRPNISALLSLANLTFSQGNYKEALSLYGKAMREHPRCPAEVRLGLAACQFRLGHFDRARAAYERTLQLNPDCCEALLGLAVLSFNAPDADKGLREGIQLLCKAYNSDPLHPGVLTLLAHFCLLHGDYDKAKGLATTAFETAETDAVRANGLTVLARASHGSGAITDALRYYQQASKLDPKAALPLFGLAQMNLLQHEHTNAISLLENALQQVPGWNDALQVLGNLYPQMERKGQAAVAHFKEAAQKNNSSGEVWEMLGELLASTDPIGSLAAYKKSLELTRKEKEAEVAAKLKAQERGRASAGGEMNGHASDSTAAAGALAMDRVGEDAGGAQPSQPTANGFVVATVMEGNAHHADPGDELTDQFLPAKLLNNAAVLHMRCGDKQTALRLMQEAQQAASQAGTSGLAAGNHVTLGFNLARAKEAVGMLGEAERDYSDILKEFPQYTDCYLRLASIAYRRGKLSDALRWAEKAQEAKPKDPNALALIGFVHIQQREWKEAEDTFKELRSEPSLKNDPYAMMAQGIIPLVSLKADSKKEQPGKAEKLLAFALEIFKKVLEKNESNIYAAHGIAAVLAEQATRAEPPKEEYLAHAKAIFSMVKDAAASAEAWLQMPDVAENLGHIALAEGRVKDALQLYGSVQRRRHHGTSAHLLLLSARALYDEDGRRSELAVKTGVPQPSTLHEARACLLKAIHLDPANPTLRFNVGFCMQEEAVRNLKKPRPEQDTSKAPEYERALVDLAQAHRFFNHLIALGTHRTGIDKKKLSQHLEFCTVTHTKAAQLLEVATKEMEALESRRQQSKLELDAAARQRALEEEAARRKAERAAQEKDRMARQAQERLEELRASWAENKALQEAAAEGDAQKADKRRKKKKKEEEVDTIFGNSDSDDGGDYVPGADPEEAEYQDNDPAGADEELDNDALEQDRRILKGTGLSSDEEEEAQPSGRQLDDATPGSKGRLKRHRAEQSNADALADIEDGLGDLQEDVNGDIGETLNKGGSSPKRSRKTATDLFGDSDEE